MNANINKRVIFYIDGFSLYHGMNELYSKKYLWLDIQVLAKRLRNYDEDLIQINYFTTIIRNNPPKQARQIEYISIIKTINRVAIYLGNYNLEYIKCHNCNKHLTKWREKKTDVNMSVKLFTDAFDDKFDVLKIITGYKDLKSPIK